eukprot:11862837-Alexandrium_andersonii.AAC.1
MGSRLQVSKYPKAEGSCLRRGHRADLRPFYSRMAHRPWVAREQRGGPAQPSHEWASALAQTLGP